MNIEDFLKMLTAEQLEELAKLKKQENNTQQVSNKRKQQRKPKKKEIVGGESHPRIPKKTNSRRQQTQLGKNRNNFVTSSDFNEHQDDIEIDKKMFSGKVSPRSKERTIYLEATCSMCNCVFEDVPNHQCYKDDNGYTFICESCSGRMRK